VKRDSTKNDDTIACSVKGCVVRRKLRPGEAAVLSWSWTCDGHVRFVNDNPIEPDHQRVNDGGRRE
jgi:hypothetical protein